MNSNTVAFELPAVSKDKRDYWRVYHSPGVLERADTLRKTYSVRSTGVRLHVDAYEQKNTDAPVFIFNHGAGGYSRMFLPIALAMYDRGYTVIIPDQRGQGLSEGNRRDFRLTQFIQNIVDVTKWAKARYAGKLFLAGGSLGGALTYKAAAAGAPVRAIVCHNLYDFGDPKQTLALSSFAPAAKVPGLAQLFSLVTRSFAALMPWLPLPYRALAHFDRMVDERVEGFYDKYKRDPYPIKWITLGYLASMFRTPPAIPLERNTIPVLVINQTRDKMTDPAITRRNYERLGGPKEYAEIDYGHWSIGGTFEQEWTSLVDDFLKRH